MSNSDPAEPIPTEPSPVAPARIELASTMASLELSVVATDFRPVARGIGRLTADVEPGIYQIVARAGPITDRRLISLSAGQKHGEWNVSVAFPTAAPIRETSTWLQYHESAAQEASGALEGDPSADAGLVIVLRDVRGRDGPALTPADVATLTLLDGRLETIAGSADRWKVRAEDAIATWSGRLPAGGYALRVDPSVTAGSARSPDGAAIFDQSVWLSPGWKTIVFIATGPNGIQPAGASVHMTDMGTEWYPQETWQGLALELAYWGLRAGRCVVPADLMGVLLNAKFQNPMLGILGAHSLLLQQPVDLPLLEIVVGNLERLVPGHPDVIALRSLAAEAAERAGNGAEDADPAPPEQAGIDVSWPPMLLASYRALIRRDARQPGAIRDGSAGELAASNVLVQGIWTSWRPIQRAAVEARAGGPPAVWVLPALAAEPARLEGHTFQDPAAARVADYLTALAALEGASGRTERFATLSPQEIGLATSLPAASVDRALSGIGATIALPPLGGGPDGPGPDGGTGGGSSAASAGGSIATRAVPLVFAAGAVISAGIAGFVLGAFAGGPAESATPTAAATAGVTAPPTASPRVTDGPTAPPTRPATAPPLPELGVAREVTFGDTLVGTPASQDLRIRDRGDAPLTIVGFTVGGDHPRDFSVLPGDCLEGELAPRSACNATITFAPTAPGQRVADLVIETLQLGTRHVRLTGVGLEQAAGLVLRPTAIDFGSVQLGDVEPRPLLLMATGPISLSDWTIGGDGATDFEFHPIDCAQLELQAGETCAVVVTFNPSDFLDTRSAELRLFTSDGASHAIPLTGFAFTVE